MNPDGTEQIRLTSTTAYEGLPDWGTGSTTTTKIGVYQHGTWYLDNDGSGTWNSGG